MQVSHRLLASGLLVSEALAAMKRRLGIFICVVVAFFVVGLTVGDPFFSSRAGIQVAIGSILMLCVPVFLLSMFSRTEYQILVDDTQRSLIFRTLMGRRVFKEREIPLADIDSVEVRTIPSVQVGIPSELVRHRLVVQRDRGPEEQFLQLSDKQRVEEVAEKIRSELTPRAI